MSGGAGSVKVAFQPLGRRTEVPPGATLLAAAQSVGIDLQATCGGLGTCGSCRVRLAAGAVSAMDEDEAAELGAAAVAAGYRLACQARVQTDVRIEIPPDSLMPPQRLQLECAGLDVALDPVVTPEDLTLAHPDLSDPRADLTRVGYTLGAGDRGLDCGVPLIAEISRELRDSSWRIRLALRREGTRRRAVAVLPYATRLLGFAADIGTTKVAMYLLDLESGETLGASGATNPQIGCGEDVISRLAFAEQTADGSRILGERIRGCLAEGLTDLCGRAGVATRQVVDAVLVGNTAMHHLLVGLPTRQLGVAPYIAAVSRPLDIPASDLGLPLAIGAEAHLPPLIAGFVGSDHVAALVAARLDQAKDTVLLLDIGTNTEISLLHQGRLRSCSCPSGPAFEGAHLTVGMRAAPGAIEAVRITGNRIVVRTIDDLPPIGICGSGILDATAELLGAGALDERGNLNRDHPLVRPGARGGEVVVVPAPPGGQRRELVVNRADILEIQLAKAAIRGGIAALLAHAEVAEEVLDRVIIAGAFGSYLDVRSAIRIGMFPELPLERYQQVGNAAGLGARQMLLSATSRRLGREMARTAEYLELSLQQSFTRRFLKSLGLARPGEAGPPAPSPA
jgi:uncharacterized 2Fe-2S/4Fe-4S cluster protein (DUF4445 family)